jgi:diguanylate cyclase (GGDEF)-like protein
VSEDKFKDLRREAEEQLAARGRQINGLDRADLGNLAHELAVHQVELEIQNEELRQSRTVAEEARDRYVDLYDFAPMGYFTLDEHSQIVEANLTGCQLLKVDRNKLITQRFTKFITVDETDNFYLHRKKVLENGKQTFELKMQKADGTPFFAQVDSIKVAEGRLRLALVDTSKRKHAEIALEQYIRELTMLNNVAKSLSESVSLNVLLRGALDSVLECMDLPIGALYLVDQLSGELVVYTHKGSSYEFTRAMDRIPLGTSIIGKAVETKQVLFTKDAAQDKGVADSHKPYLEAENIRCFICVPLKSRGRIVGVIKAGTGRPRDFSNADIRLLEILGGQIGVAIEHARLLEEMSRLSNIDSLTGLYNRRRFFEILELEISRSRRYGRHFCVVMMDIDGFKKYNDKFGHTSGDRLLETFAQILKSGSRNSDITCRYGGDEFAIMLPSADAERATIIAERIISMLLQVHEVQYIASECHLGLSAGIAEFPGTAETADGLVFLADCALYDAKRQGGKKARLVSDMRVFPAEALNIATIGEVSALAATVDARDSLTYGHSNRVAAVSEIIGKAIGMPERELTELHSAAVLHDIGKIGIPDSILAKPGKPTKHEWEVLKEHAVNGSKIVAHIKDLSGLIPMILHHHEWYNGKGYPDKLRGENIPLGARIISIADAYDTMTTLRPYRKSLVKNEAIEELKRCSGTQFDPKLTELFCRAINEAS